MQTQEHSILDYLLKQADLYPGKVLLRSKGSRPLNIRWDDFLRDIENTMRALLKEGIARHPGAAVLSGIRYESFVADLAIQAAGKFVVPLSPETGDEDLSYIMCKTGIKIVFAENEEAAGRVRNVRGIKKIIIFDGGGGGDSGSVSFSRFTGIRAEGGETLEEAALNIRPEGLSSVLFAGRGRPRKPLGVMTTHRSIIRSMQAFHHHIRIPFPDRRTLCLLPMSHPLGRMEFFLAIADNGTIYLPDSRKTREENFNEVKPTLLFSRPDLFRSACLPLTEKMAAAGNATLSRRGLLPLGIYLRGKIRRKKSLLKKFDDLVGKIFFGKLCAGFGGMLKLVLMDGALPEDPELAEFLSLSGITVLDGFVLPETTFFATLSTQENSRGGALGTLLPGVNLKNDAAGRILLKSDQLFDGYYGDPLSTKEALKNGWFNTGAPGRLDEEGFLYLGENPRQRPAG